MIVERKNEGEYRKGTVAKRIQSVRKCRGLRWFGIGEETVC